MKFCSRCGAQLNGNESFCGNCGASVSKDNVSNQPYQNHQNQQYQQYQNPNVAEKKSKPVAGILGIFLGAFGVHNFYLGYTGKAIAQLLITILSCGILSFVSGIWGFIEGILILCGTINVDAKGIPLSD